MPTVVLRDDLAQAPLLQSNLPTMFSAKFLVNERSQIVHYARDDNLWEKARHAFLLLLKIIYPYLPDTGNVPSSALFLTLLLARPTFFFTAYSSTFTAYSSTLRLLLV